MLGAVGCHPNESAPPQQAIDLPPPAPPNDAGAVDAAVVENEPQTPRDAGGDGGISPETALRYKRLADHVATMRTAIDQVSRKVAATSPTSNTWVDLVGEIQNLSRGLGYGFIYCPKPRPETDEFLRHVQKERADLSAAIDELKARAATKLATKTTPGTARYDALLQQYDTANPQPCLSMSCDNW